MESDEESQGSTTSYEEVLIKVYDSWYDLPVRRYGDSDDLDGVMIYHKPSRGHNRLASRLMDNSPENSDEQELTKEECKIAGVKYPASVVGLHH